MFLEFLNCGALMKRNTHQYAAASQVTKALWLQHRFTYLCGTFGASGVWQVVYIVHVHTLN